MKKFWKNAPIRFKIGFIAVAILLILAFIVTLFYTGPDITQFNTFKKDLKPSWEHPLGTTSLGQDTFWMLLLSLKHSIEIGLMVAAIGGVVGVMYGLIAGFVGGGVDRVMMTVADTFIVIH